jgi:hypothetical protein
MKKYKTDFLTFGFTYQFVNGEEHPQCVLHLEALSNNSLNARNLCRHLTKRLASLANKPLEFSEQKLLEMLKHLNLMKIAVSTFTKALLVSYMISCLIAKNKKKPHTIEETLLLLAVIKNV